MSPNETNAPPAVADLERRLEALERRLESDAQKRTADVGSRVERIELWIKVALGLAVAFGIGGAWGYTVISSVESKVSGVEETLARVESQAASLATTFSDLERQKIPELEQSLLQLKLDTVTVNKEAEVAVARMREEAAGEVARLYRESRDTSSSVEKRWREAEEQVAENAESALGSVRRERDAAGTELGEARRVALATIAGQVRETLRTTTATWDWKDCAIEMIGPDRTHWTRKEDGPWCPRGKFIVQMNFDASGRNKELFVKNILCCAPGVELGGEEPAAVVSGGRPPR